MVKRVVAREGIRELNHRQFCDEVKLMLHDFNVGHPQLRTPISLTKLNLPTKDVLDMLDRERTLRWHVDWDESFYGERSYLWDTFYYYSEFSIGNIFPFAKYLAIEEAPKSVFDVGGGLGMTTVHLQAMMPDAQLYYMNVPGAQVNFARKLFERFAPTVKVVDVDPRTWTPVGGAPWPNTEMVAYLDVLEHVREPMPFLRTTTSPDTKVILDSSAWGRPAAGHWMTYKDVKDGVLSWLPAKNFKRRWKGTIKDRHVEVLGEMGFSRWEERSGVKYDWNEMPSIWVRDV